MPTVSVITAVYNCQRTIGGAIESVLEQDYDQVEYIVIDGMSTDGTADVVSEYGDRISKVIREPDEGIYDALNKGINSASGDVIGFLHADDLLASPKVLSRVASTFIEHDSDAVFGELLYVSEDDVDKVIRYWKEKPFNRKRFHFGWMPPHPTCYIRKSCYERFGQFRTDMSIAADYELLLRLMLKEQISVRYLDEVIVRMRVGGKSNQSLSNRRLANREDALAWELNGLKKPPCLRVMKPLRKVSQYFVKPEVLAPKTDVTK